MGRLTPGVKVSHGDADTQGMTTAFHITDRSRLESIAREGLQPRSADIEPNFEWAGDDESVYVFLKSNVADQWARRCRSKITDPVLLRVDIDMARVHMDSESVRLLIDQCGDIALAEKHPWAVELTCMVRAHWDLELRDLDDCVELAELAPTLQGMIRRLPAEAREQLMAIAGAGTYWTESMCVHDGPITGCIEVHDGEQWAELAASPLAG